MGDATAAAQATTVAWGSAGYNHGRGPFAVPNLKCGGGNGQPLEN